MRGKRRRRSNVLQVTKHFVNNCDSEVENLTKVLALFLGGLSDNPLGQPN